VRNVDAMSAMTAARLDTNVVESLSDRIQRLVGERQALRAAAADPEALEENRRAICRLQHELSLALIARHQPA
jgi:hypothetical protein